MCLVYSNFNLHHNYDKASWFTFLSDIFCFSLFPWDFCVVQTGVCSSHWQCENWFGTAFAECWLQCTLNEASGRCTGFEHSPTGNVWPQVFICYVGRPTGECEAHIILRHKVVILCCWNIACILPVPVTQPCLSYSSFAFSITSLQLSHLHKGGKRSFPLHTLYAVPGDTLWGDCVDLNGHRESFVSLLGTKGELIHR